MKKLTKTAKATRKLDLKVNTVRKLDEVKPEDLAIVIGGAPPISRPTFCGCG